MAKKFCRMAALAGLAFFWASRVSAYQPTVDEIVTRFLENTAATTRAIIETRSVVFDPFASNGTTLAGAGNGATLIPGVGSDEVLPVEQPEREFLQRTYWIRHSFLAVETLSTGGELLHFYLNEKFREISFSSSPERPFSDWDVLSPYLPFLEAGRPDWLEGLDRWGVQPERVEFVRTPKGQVHFNLVEGPGKRVWVERERHRPLKIETLIEGGERSSRLSVAFSEFFLFGNEQNGWVMYPRTTNFLLDGRLFKQTTVRRFENEPPWKKFPLTRLRRKGKAVLKEAAERGVEMEEK